MQDRYAADMGDYFKLSLLQHMARGRRLGVAWYAFPEEIGGGDGGHVRYLHAPERWRHLNPSLFDMLAPLVPNGRSIAALHATLPDGTVFASEPLPAGTMPGVVRSRSRREWFQRTMETLVGSEIVFADPDNGLTDDDEHRRVLRGFGKQIPIAEARALAEGRTAIVYHHNSRFKGGHDAEVDYWIERLDRPVTAVRCTAYGCRTFLLVNPDATTTERVGAFCHLWRNNGVRLHLRSS